MSLELLDQDRNHVNVGLCLDVCVLPGHTPNFDHIQSRCNGQVIIIDTGISKAYGGRLSALEIQYDLYEADPARDIANNVSDGEFVEVESVTALYMDTRDVLDKREAKVRFDTSRPAVEST